MKRILVTGAGGFIGSAVARQLVKDGHEVITIDNLSTGYREVVPEGVELIEGGCEDIASFEKLGDKPCDAIFHIAGQSSGEISYDNPVYDLQTNAQSTLLLLDYARKVGCREVIYASTMSVHGRFPDEPAGESLDLKPLSFYAVGKIASEHYLRIYATQYGIRTTALRLFNVYGPGQNLANLRQGMVSIFLAQALETGRVLVMGSKDRYRDHVYIDDVVEAFLRSWNREGDDYECLNVGTGVRTTVEQLIDLISRLAPGEVEVKYQGSTPGDMFGIYADGKKTADLIGWTPKVALEEGLEAMMKWAVELKKNSEAPA